jgi:HopA1 effector protein family
MIPFDQQLRSIVAAVAFTSPAHARVTGASGSQRDIAAAGERDEHGGLALALYADHYCRLTPGRTSAAGDKQAFLASLQAANPVVIRHSDGWTVTRLDTGGAWLADASQQPRFATSDEIVPLAGRIAPGLPVRLVPRRDFVTAPNGHLVIAGRPCFDAQSGRQIRFYWNLRSDGAALFLRAVGAPLERRRIPFQAKVPVDPANYARTDCGVLYLNDEDLEAARDIIPAAYHALRDHLDDQVPMFTREIAPGLAFAESPPTRESFGMHRCGLIAEALVWIERQGIRDQDARLTALGERLTRYGLDLNRLERNPTSQYSYRLDELMQERAA